MSVLSSFLLRCSPAVLAGMVLLSGPLAAQKPAAQKPAAQKPAAQKPAVQPAAAEKALPKLEEMQVPSMKQLLQGKHVCWVVTLKDEVIVSEPVKPKPFTRVKMLQLIEDWPKGKTIEQRKKMKTERLRLDYLTIVLPGVTEEPEYQLPLPFLKMVIHHEDLVLRRIDLLMNDSKFREAFEMLLTLPTRVEGRKEVFWPGYVDRRNRLMMREIEAKISQKKFQSALAYLDDLKALMKQPLPPLQESDKEKYVPFRGALPARFGKAAGDAADPLIRMAVEQKDYRQARFFIRDRLQSLVATHPVALRWQTTLENQQQMLLQQSIKATAEGAHDQAAALAEKSAKVWPYDVRREGAVSLRTQFVTALNRFQRLKVGVVRLSGTPSVCPFPTESDRRQNELLTQTLFYVERFDSVPIYQTNYFEQYEPTDLGRQVEFTLRPGRTTWQAGPALTAAPVVRMLTTRIDPDSEFFDERLANYLSGMTVRSPRSFVMRFSRIPINPEALLRMPVVTAAAKSGPSKILSRRFRVHKRTDDQVIYRREIPEPDGLDSYHVAELCEVRYDSYEKVLQGLLRGEFSVLPRLPSWMVEKFRENERLKQRFFVVPYSVPTTHVVQFNPASKPLRNAELRRALAFALDRSRILAETVLHDPRAVTDPDSALGRVVTAPFPSRSYAYNSAVEPREHNLILAHLLGSVAGNRMGGKLPELVMVCSTEPIVHAAAKAIVARWKRVGIPVRLVVESPGDGKLPTWDLAYRTLQMTEPMFELWPFLTMQPLARVRDLMYLPDWLRQELIDLDRAENFSVAVETLQRLHLKIQEQVLTLPLWEVNEVMLIPRHVRGFAAQPLSPYQELERWTIPPRVPLDSLPQVTNR